MINLSSFIAFHARLRGDSTAFVHDGQAVSYAAFDTRIARTGAWLRERGLGAGDVVAVLMKNSPAFLDIAFAVSHIGAVFLPLNFRLAADEIAYILDDAGARLLLADEEFAGRVPAGCEAVLLDTALQADASALAPAGLAPAAMTVRDPQHPMRLMYTSGTTDRPKGVLHSYQNFYWKCMDHVIGLDLRPDARLLVVGPLYHVGAFDLPGMAVLWRGGMLCLHRDFEPAAVLASIQAHRLDCAWLAPVMTSQLLALPDRERYDVSSLRWVIGGGEKTPEARIREFGAYFRNARYIDGYGLTESCSGDTLMEAGRELEKIGSTGRALPHVELEIRDEAGAALAPHEEGEICLRGARITQGYWNAPDKNAASFFEGGWFRTGDVGYLDDEGFLYLTDRKKDMIISGGENIASSEVERVIYELPQVAECAVIGVPDERWGERPEAVVTLRPGTTLDLETLQRHCREHLAGFKLPKALHQIQALPRNPSGKVLKRVLREQFAAAPQGEA